MDSAATRRYTPRAMLQAARLTMLPLTRRCLLAAVVLLPGAARAHAILEDSTPPVGGAAHAGDVMVRLRYNSRIDRARSKLTLTRPDHSEVVLPIDPDGPPDVMTTHAVLAPGDYTLRWQVLAVDGHITRGDVPFTVTAP